MSVRPVHGTYLKGALYALAAVSIWASWSAFTRLAVTTAFDAWDIAALRFGAAGLVLAPVVVRRGLALDCLGWTGLVVLLAGAGVPYVLLAAGGLRYAPAHDQGALNPGFMPLFVAIVSPAALGETLSRTRKAGLWLILVGALVLVGWHAAGSNPARTLGQLMFLAAALLWACFTVVLRRTRIDPLHATALVSTGSAILYLPCYLILRGPHLAQLPAADIALHAAFQGLVVTALSLILYGRSIALLGATGAAAFGSLVPALSALLAIPLLGEWPSGTDWLAIALISVGVYLASGGPLLRPRNNGAA
jgi:drug/metabolite transporter (DMT)-like permease